MSRGNSQNHASRVASGAGPVFNATKAALRERLARDGILHVGWGNALSVSCLKRIFGFLAPPDLFQVAYMFVKSEFVVDALPHFLNKNRYYVETGVPETSVQITHKTPYRPVVHCGHQWHSPRYFFA